MTELGKRLKEAREEKGLSLDDLQDITKIQKRYLLGIEQGKYDMIPGKFYVRAFIKQYAEAVDLKADALFDEYRNEIPSVYEDDLPEQLSRTQSRKMAAKTPSKIFEVLPKVVAALFVVGLVVFLWFVIQKYLGNDTASVNDQANNNTPGEFEERGTLPDDRKEDPESKEPGENPEDEEPPVEEEPDVQQELVSVEFSGENTVYELKNAERFDLRVATTEGGESWISIQADKDEIFRQLISDLNEKVENTTPVFSLLDENYQSVRIRVGRAFETEIYVNDMKLEYAQDPTEVKVQNIIINFVENEE